MVKIAICLALCLALIAVVSANGFPYRHQPRHRRAINEEPNVETDKTTKPIGDDLKTDSTFWYRYNSPGFAPYTYLYPESYYYNYWWY